MNHLHDLTRYPRSLNRLYAAVYGYFWLPCPLCGTYFGGHEAEATWWPDLTNVGHSICWKHGGDVGREGLRYTDLEAP